MNLWNQPAALFSPKRRLVNDDTGKVSRGGVFGGQEWVVGRGECQYRREDLRALPARKRMQAGRLAAARHRPSPAALTYVAWVGGVAHFWFWLDPASAGEGAPRRWVPESVLLPPPASDGVRLLQLARGVEAQHWEHGVLASSQWWPNPPGTEDWLRFVRSTGLDPATLPGVPEPQRLPWAAQPWGKTSWTQRLAGAFDEKAAWLLLFALLAAGLGWQLAALLRWQSASEQLKAQVERVRTAVDPLLSAREQAEQARDELQHLQALRPPGSDYLLMAGVARHLPEGSTLAVWKREAGKLQVTVRSSETDPRAFVEAFEGDAQLSDVAVTPQAGGMQLAFELPVAAVADADAKADAAAPPQEGVR